MTFSSGPPAVIPATADDLDTVAAVLAAAYHDHPIARWVAPDIDRRPRLLHAWYRIWSEHALDYGAVDLLADRSGVAVWLDRTATMPDPFDYERRVTAACGLAGLDMLMVDHVASHHRFPVQHHHLTHLGAADGPHHAQRLDALLHHRHAQLDAAGALAAAEATTDTELDLLRAHGYRHAEPYFLPDGPLVRPLLRVPRRHHPEPAQHTPTGA
jgi:hypothetical protein